MSSKLQNSLYKSINPVSNTLFHTSAMHSELEIEAKLSSAHSWYLKNRRRGHEGMLERFEKLQTVKALLHKNKDEYAKLMTSEMGKPLA